MSCKHGNWSDCEQCAEEEALWDRAHQAGFKAGKAQAANAVARAKIDDLESRGWQQVGVALGRDGDTPAVTVTNFGRVIWHDSPAQDEKQGGNAGRLG